MAEKNKKFTIRNIISAIFTFMIISFLLSAVFDMYLSQTNYLEGNVAVIDIKGPIYIESQPTLFSSVLPTTSELIVRELEKVQSNPNIKAVILNINSPGGSGVASLEIVNALDKVNKTKVAVIREVGASAAYWAAAGTDYIIANQLSFVGSIGATMSTLNYAGLLERYNITYNKLTSGEYKDIGTPFREMETAEKAVIQEILDEGHKIFQDYVIEHRNLNSEQIKAIDTSLFFSGIKAKKIGLIAKLGDLSDTEDVIQEHLNISVEPARFRKSTGLFGSSMGFSSAFYMIGKGIGESFISHSEENQFKIMS